MSGLDNNCIGLLRGLWPEAKFTDELRNQFKETLAQYPSDILAKAIKYLHRKRLNKTPSLPELLTIIKSMHKDEVNKVPYKLAALDEYALNREIERMRQDIDSHSAAEREQAIEQVERILSKQISRKTQEWNRTTTAMIWSSISKS